MDRPERHELYVLGDEQQKLTYAPDTKMRDAGNFTILKEGHTLGNLLRMQLLRDNRVLFAGYKCPHPLQAKFELKVRTTSATDPITVTKDACLDIIEELGTIEQQLTLQIETKGGQRTHTDMWAGGFQ